MSHTVACVFFFVILASHLGLSQILVSNDTDTYVCFGEVITYECFFDASYHEWIIPGHTSITLFSHFGVGEYVESGVFRAEVVSSSIFSTILIVKYNDSFNSLTIICDYEVGSKSLMYEQVNDEFSPSINFTYLSITPTVQTQRNVVLQWIDNADISKYVLYCLNDACGYTQLNDTSSSAVITLMTNSPVVIVLELVGLCSKNYSVSLSVPQQTPSHSATTEIPLSYYSTNSTLLTISGTNFFADLSTQIEMDVSTGSENVMSSSTLLSSIFGGIAGVIFLIVLVFLTLTFIYISRHKRNKERPQLMKPDDNPHEGAIGEYATMSHNTSECDKLPMETYSRLEHTPNEKFKLCGGTTYAELGLMESRSLTKKPDLEETIVYSSVAVTEGVTSNPDFTLDLNMLLIQLREIENEWESLGKALGIPDDVLNEVENMEAAAKEKFVEVLDYWIFMHTKSNPPTWKEVANGLQVIGHGKLAAAILEVYKTGSLPILVDESVPAVLSESVPPIPPKLQKDMVPPVPPKKAIQTEDYLPPPPRPPKLVH